MGSNCWKKLPKSLCIIFFSGLEAPSPIRAVRALHFGPAKKGSEGGRFFSAEGLGLWPLEIIPPLSTRKYQPTDGREGQHGVNPSAIDMIIKSIMEQIMRENMTEIDGIIMNSGEWKVAQTMLKGGCRSYIA